MNKSKTTSKPSLSSQAGDERRALAKKAVEDGMTALLEEIGAGRTERLTEWLAYCAQFHRYSAANQHLIAGQCRLRGLRATYVASYSGWQELGKKLYGTPYQVQKGEKALFVWAPRPSSKKVKNKETNEEEEQEGLGFVLVPVFADFQIAQGTDAETGTEHPPIDHFFTPQPSSEEAQHLYETLRGIATQEGFACVEEQRSDAVQGYNRGKHIMVKATLDATSKFSTLVHEYTHAVLHQEVQLDKQVVECESEAVAFVVSLHFGMHNPFSSDYLLAYGNTAKSVIERMERIRATAHTIIEKMEQVLAASEETVAA